MEKIEEPRSGSIIKTSVQNAIRKGIIYKNSFVLHWAVFFHECLHCVG